jgi:hypothetical protein
MTLPKINKENGLIFLIIILLGAWIGIKLFTPKVIETTETTETITTDTTQIEVDTTFSEKAKPKKPIRPKKVKPREKELELHETPEKPAYDSIRSYSGTYTHDYGKFDWTIETKGLLDSYTFNPEFSVPQITTTKEKTITQTRTIIQKGVFAGGGMNTAGQFHAGATYLGNKFMIEYNFVPQTVQNISYGGVHQVGFKYKIF